MPVADASQAPTVADTGPAADGCHSSAGSSVAASSAPTSTTSTSVSAIRSRRVTGSVRSTIRSHAVFMVARNSSIGELVTLTKILQPRERPLPGEVTSDGIRERPESFARRA